MSMKLTVRGKGAVTLQDKQYITEGGEGRLFAQGKIAYKVFHDTTKMVNPAKIDELIALQHPNIVSPIDLLLDKNNQPIGYTMTYYEPDVEVVHFPRLFVTDYRDRVGFTDAKAVELIEEMKNTIKFIHSKNFLLVDINENNYLINLNKMTQPLFIDTCSWKTPSFKPTAFSPATKDWHAADFSELTDWFSFSVLSCMVFLGIHPFRGNHPGFARNDLTGRMKANISIFNPKTTYPSSVRDFVCIPAEYRDWFVALFEQGKRLPPPDKAGKVGVILMQVVTTIESLNFKVTLLAKHATNIIDYSYINGKTITKLGNGSIVVDKITYPKQNNVIITTKMAKPYFVSRNPTTIKITDTTGTYTHEIQLSNNQVMMLENRLYVISKSKLIELEVTEMGRDMLTVNQQWDMLPGQTGIYDGMLILNALGTPYLVIPERSKVCRFIKFPDLKGKVVNAKYMSKVAMIVVQNKTQLDKLVIRFTPDFEPETRVISGVQTPDINFTVLPNGLVAHIHEDGELEVFSNNTAVTKTKLVQDSKIVQGMRLTTHGSNVAFYRGMEINQLSMK